MKSKAIDGLSRYCKMPAQLVRLHQGARIALTLIETMVVMIIAVAAMSAGAWMYSDYLDNQSNRATAQHLRFVSNAFSRYVYDNHMDLLAQMNASGSTTSSVPVNALKPIYLPLDFQNKNPFGQEYVFSVRRPDPTRDEIQALVHTRYTDAAFALEPARAQEIARLVGIMGGYTSANDPGEVKTPYGQYELNPVDFGVSISDGALVSALFVHDQSGTGSERYLHRNVTGNPEHNRMSASIDMSGNDVNGANVISGQTATFSSGASVGGDITVGGTVSSGSVVSNAITSNGNIAAAGQLSSNSIVTNSLTSNGSISAAANVYSNETISNYVHSYGNVWGNGVVSNNVHSNGTMNAHDYYIRATGRWASESGGIGLRPGVVFQEIPVNYSAYNSGTYAWQVIVKKHAEKAAVVAAYLGGQMIYHGYGPNSSHGDAFSFTVPPGYSFTVQGSGWAGGGQAFIYW